MCIGGVSKFDSAATTSPNPSFARRGNCLVINTPPSQKRKLLGNQLFPFQIEAFICLLSLPLAKGEPEGVVGKYKSNFDTPYVYMSRFGVNIDAAYR